MRCVARTRGRVLVRLGVNWWRSAGWGAVAGGGRCRWGSCRRVARRVVFCFVVPRPVRRVAATQIQLRARRASGSTPFPLPRILTPPRMRYPRTPFPAHLITHCHQQSHPHPIFIFSPPPPRPKFPFLSKPLLIAPQPQCLSLSRPCQRSHAFSLPIWSPIRLIVHHRRLQHRVGRVGV